MCTHKPQHQISTQLKFLRAEVVEATGYNEFEPRVLSTCPDFVFNFVHFFAIFIYSFKYNIIIHI